MADRIIRDEIASSDRWLSLPRNTHRLAFLTLLLRADDLGNLEATPGALWRAWRDPLALTDRQAVAEVLTSLADADLIRLYEVDGKRYAHVPRFRQRLRSYKRAHPRPPSNIECKEIRDLFADCQADVGHKSDMCQTPAVEGSEGSEGGEGSEEKKERAARTAGAVAPAVSTSEKKRTATPASRGTRLPAGWFLPDAWRDWTVRAYGIEPQKAVRISLDFRDFWWAKPGRDGVKLDWEATWRRWVRRELENA